MSGFETPGLDVAAVTEFVGGYRCGVDPLRGGDIAGRAGRSLDERLIEYSAGTGSAPPAAAVITVNAVAVMSVRPPPARVVFEAAVGEFGRGLDSVGAGLVGSLVQRVLIGRYLRTIDVWHHDTLARVVGGYRGWRAQIIGSDVFDAGAVLARAFRDVVVDGDDVAADWARALYRLLVSHAAV